MEYKVTTAAPIWASAEGLVLPLFSDVRPLRGITGIVDWYLDGRITQLILQGHITGQRGEQAVISIPRLVQVPRILVVGVGPYRKNGSLADIEYYHQAGRLLKSLNIRAGAVAMIEREGIGDPEIAFRYIIDEIPPQMKRSEEFRIHLIAPS